MAVISTPSPRVHTRSASGPCSSRAATAALVGTWSRHSSSHTYIHNRIYQKPIFPLGQSYDDPPPSDMERFRQVAAVYGSSGLSWWSWQASADRGWQAIGAQIQPLAEYTPSQDLPLLAKGKK